MKVAELFVSLGFQIEGRQELETVDRNLGRAELSALALLAAVAAVNAAFLAMMNRAVDAAVGLDMFAKTTGESTQELQQWQAMAAKSNVSATAVTEAIKNIQHVRSEIALGNVDASSPWFLLGIDPRQDPIKVLGRLKDAIKDLDPAIARNLIGRMGFGDDILYLLKQNKSLGSLFVNDRDRDRLTSLGGAWKNFLFNLTTSATSFSATFASGLERIVEFLNRGVMLLDRFVGWLNSGTSAANTMKTGLIGLVALVGVLGVALAGIAAILGVIKAITLALELSPIGIALTAILLVVGGLALALAALILLIEDFWTQASGGKSRYDWNENLILSIRNVERLAKAFEWVIANQAKIKDWSLNFNPFIPGAGAISGWLNGPSVKPQGFPGARGDTTVDVDIHVDGSQDPVTTGREVGKSVKREISDAFGAMALPTN